MCQNDADGMANSVDSWSGKNIDIKNEPRHDKTNKMSVRPAKTQTCTESDQSLRCPHEESLGP